MASSSSSARAENYHLTLHGWEKGFPHRAEVTTPTDLHDTDDFDLTDFLAGGATLPGESEPTRADRFTYYPQYLVRFTNTLVGTYRTMKSDPVDMSESCTADEIRKATAEAFLRRDAAPVLDFDFSAHEVGPTRTLVAEDSVVSWPTWSELDPDLHSSFVGAPGQTYAHVLRNGWENPEWPSDVRIISFDARGNRTVKEESIALSELPIGIHLIAGLGITHKELREVYDTPSAPLWVWVAEPLSSRDDLDKIRKTLEVRIGAEKVALKVKVTSYYDGLKKLAG